MHEPSEIFEIYKNLVVRLNVVKDDRLIGDGTGFPEILADRS